MENQNPIQEASSIPTSNPNPTSISSPAPAHKGLMIAGLIIVVLVIATGTFFGVQSIINSNKTDQVVETLVATSTTVETEPTPVLLATTTPQQATTIASTTATSSASNVQNCGSIVDSHIVFEGDKRIATEVKALGCLSTAVLSCSPASLEVTGTDKGTYQIFSKTSTNCVIGSTIGKKQKCDIPLTLIADLQKYSVKEKEPIENIIVPISFFFAAEGKGITNSETGKPITISCQSY